MGSRQGDGGGFVGEGRGAGGRWGVRVGAFDRGGGGGCGGADDYRDRDRDRLLGWPCGGASPARTPSSPPAPRGRGS